MNKQAGTFQYRLERDIPIVAECDVLVVGGGPGGIGASVMAARSGARTVLVESFGVLGGMAAVGEVTPFMQNHYDATAKAGDTIWWPKAGQSMARPVYMEWLRKMASYYPEALKAQALEDSEAYDFARRIDKHAVSLAAEDLCLEAGVRLLYRHTLVDALVEHQKIAGAIFASKSGLVALKANTYVDSTGDGDLAAFSGCGYELGDEKEACQPMTLCFKLSHIDRTCMPDYETIQKLFRQAQREGVISCKRESLLYFETWDPTIIHFNTTRITGKCAVRGQELSEAEVEGRRQFREYLVWLRKSVPGFERAEIHSVSQHIGVRETRRIKGAARLERADFHERRKYSDGIARSNYPIDIHSPSGKGTELVKMPLSEYYEIPYGCIVPADVDNLVIGSRCISSDHAAHSSMRVMPVVCSIGQAAGVAAAMACSGGCGVKDIEGTDVRAQLRSMGAWL